MAKYLSHNGIWLISKDIPSVGFGGVDSVAGGGVGVVVDAGVDCP